MTPDHNHEAELMSKIRIGWRAFGRRSEILNGSLTWSVMRKVSNSCILPLLTFTFGQETWRLTERVQPTLRTTQRAMELNMIGGTLRHKQRAEWVTEETPGMKYKKNVVEMDVGRAGNAKER